MSLTLLPFNEHPHGALLNLHMEHPASHASRCFETIQAYLPVIDFEHSFVSLFLESVNQQHPRRDLCHHVLHVFGLAHIDRICFHTVKRILDGNVSANKRDACLWQHHLLAQCELRLVSHSTTSAEASANGKPRCAPAPVPAPAPSLDQVSSRPEPRLRVIVSRPQSNPPSHPRPSKIKPRPLMKLQRKQKQRAKSSPLRQKRSLHPVPRLLEVPRAELCCTAQRSDPQSKRHKSFASQTLSPPTPWQHNVSPQEQQRLQHHQMNLAEQAFKMQPLTPSPLQLTTVSSFDEATQLQPPLCSPPRCNPLRRSAPRIESSLHRALALPPADPTLPPNGANSLMLPTVIVTPPGSPLRPLTPLSRSPPRQEEAHRQATSAPLLHLRDPSPACSTLSPEKQHQQQQQIQLPRQIGFLRSDPSLGRLLSHHSVSNGSSSPDACDTICLWNMSPQYHCNQRDNLSVSPALRRMSIQDFDARSQLWQTSTALP